MNFVIEMSLVSDFDAIMKVREFEATDKFMAVACIPSEVWERIGRPETLTVVGVGP